MTRRYLYVSKHLRLKNTEIELDTLSKHVLPTLPLLTK